VHVCKPSELLEKAQSGCLAFHGIHVKMVKHIKSESSLGADELGEIDHGLNSWM